MAAAVSLGVTLMVLLVVCLNVSGMVQVRTAFESVSCRSAANSAPGVGWFATSWLRRSCWRVSAVRWASRCSLRAAPCDVVESTSRCRGKYWIRLV